MPFLSQGYWHPSDAVGLLPHKNMNNPFRFRPAICQHHPNAFCSEIWLESECLPSGLRKTKSVPIRSRGLAAPVRLPTAFSRNVIVPSPFQGLSSPICLPSGSHPKKYPFRFHPQVCQHPYNFRVASPKNLRFSSVRRCIITRRGSAVINRYRFRPATKKTLCDKP